MDQARKYFPRGLAQPEPGFRFSTDALLLACFAKGKKNARVADLGTGCGVVGLGFLLKNPEAHMTVTGLDISPDMINMAKQNAAALGLTHAFQPLVADVREIKDSSLAAGSFDLVLANPPYRRPDQGRVSRSREQRPARFELQGGLTDFAKAAAYLLKTRGKMALVYDADRLAHVFKTLTAEKIEAKRLRLVHSRADQPATLALVEAVRPDRGPAAYPVPGQGRQNQTDQKRPDLLPLPGLQRRIVV